MTLPYLACAPRDSPMYPTLEERAVVEIKDDV